MYTIKHCELTPVLGGQDAAEAAGSGHLETELRARMLRLREKLPRAAGAGAALEKHAAPAAGPPPDAVPEPHKAALASTAVVRSRMPSRACGGSGTALFTRKAGLSCLGLGHKVSQMNLCLAQMLMMLQCLQLA